MYEFTHRGAGVNWAALDQKSRRLVSGSMASAVVAVMPLFKWTADAARRVGIEFQGAMPIEGTAVSTPSLYLPAAWVMAWVIGFAALSGLLWWRMSIRQDELFHRVQNWSLGMSGACPKTLGRSGGVVVPATVPKPFPTRRYLAAGI